MLGVRFFLVCCVVLKLSSANHNFITSTTQTCIDRTKPNQSKVDCDVGDDAILTCNINEDLEQAFSVSWRKRNIHDIHDPLVLTLNFQISVPDKRFNVTANRHTNSLLIKNITHEDAAVYECRVTLSAKEKTDSTVELMIRRPPKIIEKIQVEPSPATLGSTATLTCTAEGYPKPAISWMRDHNVRLPTGEREVKGNVLRISGIQRQDRGIYYCIADNTIGQPDRRSINFDVEFPPKISTPRPKVAQAVGYSIELLCRVEGFPAPSVIWFRNGIQIHDEDDYSITTTATVNDITTSVLEISPVEQEHYGDYVCKATNKLATVDATINLYDFDIPNINFAGLQWTSAAVKIHQFKYVLLSLSILLLLQLQ